MSAVFRIRAVILAAVSALAIPGIAQADKPDNPGQQGRQKPRQAVDTGVERIASDPSGEALLEQMTSRSSAGLTLVQHDNGMLSMDLQGRFMNAMIAVRNPDGTYSLSCTSGDQARRQATPASQVVQAWKARAAAQPVTIALEEK
jgi:hypothetical protein